MSRHSPLDNHPKIQAFHSAYASLRATAREVMPRLTPVAPPPPRDSDPQAGEPLPTHASAPPSSDDEHVRDATLPPRATAWAWTEGDSDDGRSRR